MMSLEEGGCMDRTRVRQEIRKMLFEEFYARQRARSLTQEEAAQLLGIDVRTFRRWSRRFEAQGAEGLADKRLGRLSGRCAPVDEVRRVLTLFDTQYADFTVKHFHEKLQTHHDVARSYTWTKNTLQKAGRVKKAKRRGAHRRKRARKPLPGMMLHQDGSRHEWVPGQLWDLIVTMDDATNEIYSAFFVEEEGTLSSFRGVSEVIAKKGLFGSLYADRGSHYWHTPKSGQGVDRKRLTQFHRALRELHIELIPAYSPQARGRSERIFRTLQDRLPKELRLQGISERDTANRFLRDVFLPQYNRRFAVPADETGTAFVAFIGDTSEILCLQEPRVVGADNTVRYRGKCLQIPSDRYRCHYVRANVRVHEYADATLAVFFGPRCLARYTVQGVPIPQDAVEPPLPAQLAR
jgi:transposase